MAIIGAGPVGLYTALYLAKSGIDVTVFEKLEGPLKSPRAMAYVTDLSIENPPLTDGAGAPGTFRLCWKISRRLASLRTC